jgi:hypothetical protein
MRRNKRRIHEEADGREDQMQSERIKGEITENGRRNGGGYGIQRGGGGGGGQEEQKQERKERKKEMKVKIDEE